MNASRIPEAHEHVRERHNPDKSVVDQLFGSFASSLTQLAQDKVDTFLTAQEAKETVTDGERVVLDVVAGHVLLESLGTALRLAPQGPLTQDLYPMIVRHQSEFTQATNAMFPEDPHREQTLAKLVRALRASLHPTPRR